MKKILSISLLLALFGGLLIACGGDSNDDQVSVSDAWTRVTAPSQTTGAIYATLESPDDNELTGATVPDDIAGKVELHETTGSGGDEMMEDDGMSDDGMSDDSMGATGETGMEGQSGSTMMGMKPVSSIDLPAGEQVNLEPGGYHIMLLDLTGPISEGDSIPVTLSFESGDDVTVDATAREG
ncbi:MAG: copper chaperone PCu(A)C [Solirubrobacterales bacterium]|nr:copper chaperone PCu(A)C [Solirubrobacterales bacterium]